MRFERANEAHGVVAVVGFTGDFQLRVLGEQCAQASAQQRVVFDDQQAVSGVHGSVLRGKPFFVIGQ
jgi:hypothetical protein